MRFAHTEHSNKHKRSIRNNKIPFYLVITGKMDDKKWNYIHQHFTQTSHSRRPKERAGKIAPLRKNGEILFQHGIEYPLDD